MAKVRCCQGPMTEPLAHVGFSCKARWIGAQGLKGTRKYTLFNYSSSVAVKSSTFFQLCFQELLLTCWVLWVTYIAQIPNMEASLRICQVETCKSSLAVRITSAGSGERLKKKFCPWIPHAWFLFSSSPMFPYCVPSCWFSSLPIHACRVWWPTASGTCPRRSNYVLPWARTSATGWFSRM